MFFGTFNNLLLQSNIMSYWSVLKEYARSEIVDIDDQDASLTVSKQDPTNSNTLELSLTWDKVFENQPLDEEDGRMLPTTRRITVDEGDVHEDSPDIFDTLTESVRFDDHIDHITLKETSMITESPFVVTYGLSESGDITSRGESFLEDLQSLGTKNDLGFTIDDIVEYEVVYSDFETCHVSSVNGYIRTHTPSDYLSNVDSIEDIAGKVDDTEEFRESEEFIVPFSVDREELSVLRTRFYEHYMRTFVNESVDANFNYKLEGESVYVKTGEVTDNDYCVTKPEFEYTEPNGDESVYFWLHADATEVLGFNLSSSDPN